MSVRCIGQVLERSRHAGTELLMLVVLADYSDDEGNSYPAVASLARKCRMKPRNANYILSALQASGELRVLKNEGPKGTNRYRIMLANLGSAPLQRSAPLQASAPLQRGAPLQRSAPTPAMECAKPLQPIADEPSLNRQEPSSGSRRRSVATNAASFDTFWQAYPNKKAKAAAAKAFAKLKPNPVLLEQMLAAIKVQCAGEAWCKDGGRFIPHPASWLLGLRWLDEGPVATTNELQTLFSRSV